MQGLSLDSSLLPSLATAKVPGRNAQQPDRLRPFDSHKRVGTSRARCSSMGSARRSEACRTLRRPFLTRASQDRGVRRPSCTAQLGRFIGDDGQAHYNTKVKYPDGDFSQRLAGARSAAPRRFPDPPPWPCRLPASYGHPLRRERPARTRGPGGGPGRLPRSSRISSSATSGQRVVTLLWSEVRAGAAAQKRHERDRITGAAGVAFLLGEARQPQDGRRVPRPGPAGPRPRRQPQGKRSTSAPSTPRWPRSGFHVDAGAHPAGTRRRCRGSRSSS